MWEHVTYLITVQVFVFLSRKPILDSLICTLSTHYLLFPWHHMWYTNNEVILSNNVAHRKVVLGSWEYCWPPETGHYKYYHYYNLPHMTSPILVKLIWMGRHFIKGQFIGLTGSQPTFGLDPITLTVCTLCMYAYGTMLSSNRCFVVCANCHTYQSSMKSHIPEHLL